MATERFPEHLRYHPEHGWADVDGERATFGITWYAQNELHEIEYTLGAVGDDATHDAVLWAVLGEAVEPHPSGTIVTLPFQWPDDLRRRQLSKDAH